MENKLTHIDSDGHANMVDVTDKNPTDRTAIATGKITVNEAVFKAICENGMPKGDVLGTARVAGIMAAKKTSELIPLCHPLMLTKVSVDFELIEEERAVVVNCLARLSGKTGVEMEALTGAAVALLTVYDMCKALDKSMVISEVHLVKKSGGKSGEFVF